MFLAFPQNIYSSLFTCSDVLSNPGSRRPRAAWLSMSWAKFSHCKGTAQFLSINDVLFPAFIQNDVYREHITHQTLPPEVTLVGGVTEGDEKRAFKCHKNLFFFVRNLLAFWTFSVDFWVYSTEREKSPECFWHTTRNYTVELFPLLIKVVVGILMQRVSTTLKSRTGTVGRRHTFPAQLPRMKDCISTP